MKIETRNNRVLVGMSGGMESSVAAALLKSEGYEVHGLHLKLQGSEALAGFQSHCRTENRSEIVRKVCQELEIPLQVLEAGALFDESVIDYVIHERVQARNPSPCVRCNQIVRFGTLVREAAAAGAGLIATGHYAQISLEADGKSARLKRAADQEFDQSHLLFGLSQSVLRRTLMPLGGISHAMVVKLAKQFDVATSEARTAPVPCLETGAALAEQIERRVPPSLRMKGIARSPEGKVVGEHQGLYQYTIGDRREDIDREAIDKRENFVLGFDSNPQSLIVGSEDLLLRSEAVALEANWVRPLPGLKGLKCTASLGPKDSEHPCRVTLFENETVHIQFEQPLKTLIPGQAIVFHDGDEVLGGAFIDRVGSSPSSAKRP